MAYTVYAQRAGMQQGSATAKAINSYTEVWTVNFDSPVYDIAYVGSLPELPSFFTPYYTDPYAVLEKSSPRQDPDDPATWHVTLEWSRISSNPATATTDIINRPPQVSWGTTQFDKPFVVDINGQKVCNSAGELFNPPETIDDSRIVARARYNLTFVPSFILDYRGKINNAPLSIEGVFVDYHCARIQSIDVSEPKQEMNVLYREVIIVIEMRDPQDVCNVSTGVGRNATTSGRTTVPGWTKVIQDAGYKEEVPAGKLNEILDDTNLPCTTPQLLNGKAVHLTRPVAPGSEFYRLYDAIPDRDFSVLNLPP